MKLRATSQLAAPSKTLITFSTEIRAHSDLPILDLGCGYGRNAVALALRGLSVVCVDKELNRLNTLVQYSPKYIANETQSKHEVGQLYPILADIKPNRWPFRAGCFGGIISVHFLNAALFGVFYSSLITGGYLYIETFGAHGGNYLDLPKAGQLHDLLSQDFQLPFYLEKKAGPPGYDAVTVRLLGRKRPVDNLSD